MGKKIILVGDSTDHGGTVLTGSASRTVDGKPIARLGDEVDCPQHGKNKIVEGESGYQIDGVPVALEGHHTACGSVLIGSGSMSVG